MSTLTPTNAGELNAGDEIPQFKIEKIILDGELLSSSLPQLEMTVSNSSPKNKSPRDRSSAKEKLFTHSGRKMSSTSPTKREATPRLKSAVCKQSASSSIPLPIPKPAKSMLPAKTSSQNVVRSSNKLSRPNSAVLKTSGSTVNKHTLEIQFLNKKKRLTQLQKDLIEKQKPVLDLYQSLVQIKKKLEELGKKVCLEEIKLIPIGGSAPPENKDGAGESIPPEVILGMQTSIEDIPKTLMEICKNLLARRNVIVELLESIIKSEVNVGDLADQIETLKVEGAQLRSNLDVVINEHHGKIKEIVRNWQILLNDKSNLGANVKIEDLEEKLKVQEKITQQANQVIQDMQKKLDEKRFSHEKYISELNGVIHGLRDQVQKLESELEAEKKSISDYRSRISSNTQNSKALRNKIAELENDKKNNDTLNADLTKKIKQLQDQLKHKESQWTKEKEEMSKNMKHQENMLQKLSSDKTSFETRLQEVEGERTMCEESLITNIETLQTELEDVKKELSESNRARDEALEKCKGMEDQLSRMGMENIATMHMVSNSINWGTDNTIETTKADEYSESMVKDIIIQEYKDKIKKLEEENTFHKEAIALVERNKHTSPTETEKMVMIQHDIVSKYKQLLAESEQKLTEKSQEVAKLTSEIRQLKVRQEHLEELNQKCPTENLQKMVEEGRNKLSELMKKSMESEQNILHCENIIDKQSKQMNEMENLLRYRENIAGVLKASRDELILEKESLTRYSQEMRTVLAEVTKEGKMKDRLIKELQEKIDVRERQINKLEKEVRELESNLVMTNEKRFKLQETIGTLEKELQSSKAHFNELADINTRYEPGMKIYSRYSNHSDSHVRLVEDDAVRANALLQKYLDNLPHTKLSNTRIFSLIENYLNSFSTEQTKSESGKVSSNSLLGLSIKQVEYLKSRLNYLTKINALSKISSTRFRKVLSSPISTVTDKPMTDYSSSKMSGHSVRYKNLERIVDLTAKRYDYLQKQAYECYDELTGLVKLAVSSKNLSLNK